METTGELLKEADRAAAAPFIDLPESPWWYPLFNACVVTALAAGPAVTSSGQGLLGFALSTVAIVAMLVYYLNERERTGVYPRARSAPPEIRAAHARLGLGTIVILGLSALLWWQFGAVPALVVLFLATLIGVWYYERRYYPRAVARVRERLG